MCFEIIVEWFTIDSQLDEHKDREDIFEIRGESDLENLQSLVEESFLDSIIYVIIPNIPVLDFLELRDHVGSLATIFIDDGNNIRVKA